MAQRGIGAATKTRMLGGHAGHEWKHTRCTCFTFDRHQRRQFEKRQWQREVETTEE